MTETLSSPFQGNGIMPRLPDFRTLLRRRPLLSLLFLGTCLLSAGLVAWFAGQRSRAQHHRQQVEQAFAERDFARAQDHLRALLQLQPHSAEAYFLLASACRRARREDFRHAQEHLTAAKRLGWSETALAQEFSLLNFQQQGTPGQGEQALFQLLQAPQTDRPLVLEALVRGCLRADRLEEAEVRLDRWIQSSPDDWYAYLWRGTLFQYLDRPMRAVDDYEHALRCRPDSADIRYRLGLALASSGSDFRRALPYLEEHRREHPDDPDTLVGIARCLRVSEPPETARPLLLSVVAAHPDHADALLTLALLESDLENPTEALRRARRLESLGGSPAGEETFQKLLRLAPIAANTSIPTRLRTVRHLLATVLRKLGQEKEAQIQERKLEQLVADAKELRVLLAENDKNPQDTATWHKLGAVYFRLGMTVDGEFWYLRILRQNPVDRQAHRALADHYRGRPDPDSQRKAESHQRQAEMSMKKTDTES
jgi:tetratricopeptide (TPR) repeat protein